MIRLVTLALATELAGSAFFIMYTHTWLPEISGLDYWKGLLDWSLSGPGYTLFAHAEIILQVLPW